jgi:hypothetical protein
MKKIRWISLCLAGFIGQGMAEGEQTVQAKILARNHFLPLALGSVRPEGWVKVEAERAIHGLCGMEEKDKGADQPILENNVWRMGTTVSGRGAFAWWPYEQHAYFMDGVTRLAWVTGNKTLLEEVKKTYDAVADRQDEEGYFYCKGGDWKKGWLAGDEGDDLQRWKKNGFEGMHWTLAVFDRGLLAEYQATKNPRYLAVLGKQFAHYVHKGRDADKVGTPILGKELYFNRGFVTTESIVEYLCLTNDPALYQKTVEIFKNNEDGMVRNYLQGTYSTVCHGVTYNELTKLYAPAYLLTGRKEYLQAAINARNFLVTNHLLPNGVHSANEFLRGIGGFLGTETCDVVDYSWSGLWLLRATGKARYADEIEEAFYNAGQRAVQHDYKSHVYIQSPNYVPGIALAHNDAHAQYQACHDPLCCTRNLTRLLPNFIGHSVMRTQDGLALLFYLPSRVHTTVNNKPVQFQVETDYPFRDQIIIRFQNEKPVEFPLTFRIPRWCLAPQMERDGTIKDLTPDENGWVTLKDTWKKGDQLTLRLPMSLRLQKGREKILVKEDGTPAFMGGHGKAIQLEHFKIGAPFLAVHRGPLVFSLSLESEGDAQVALEDSTCKWTVQENPLSKDWCWDGVPPVSIQAEAQMIDWTLKSGAPQMPPAPFQRDPAKRKTVTLIPYGCTDLYRLTCFPVAMEKR